VQATMQAEASAISSSSGSTTSVVAVITVIYESKQVAVAAGSFQLNDAAQRDAFKIRVEVATCAGMQGSCVVTLLSWRRRALQARWLQASSVTMNVDRTYDYAASTNASLSVDSLIEADLANEGVSVQSSTTTSLSASTSVTITGTDAQSSAASTVTTAAITEALGTALPNINLNVQAPVVVTPPLPPPPPPPSQLPGSPPVPRNPPASVPAEEDTDTDRSVSAVEAMVISVVVVVCLAIVAIVAALIFYCRKLSIQLAAQRGPAPAFESAFPAKSSVFAAATPAAAVLPRRTRVDVAVDAWTEGQTSEPERQSLQMADGPSMALPDKTEALTPSNSAPTMVREFEEADVAQAPPPRPPTRAKTPTGINKCNSMSAAGGWVKDLWEVDASRAPPSSSSRAQTAGGIIVANQAPPPRPPSRAKTPTGINKCNSLSAAGGWVKDLWEVDSAPAPSSAPETSSSLRSPPTIQAGAGTGVASQVPPPAED